ncbi:MAG: thiol-disulfide isomerase [Bryobacteraceae bacterium]
MRYVVAFALASSLVAAKSPQPTFHKDVLPILQKRCQQCHREGESAPMALVTYKDARPWAKAMREAVLTGKMPPWFADPKHGSFLNDRRLAQKDVETLAAWADGGAPEGNAKDAPQPAQFVQGWKIGTPDIILEMPSEFPVPEVGTIAYQHFVVPTGFTEDRWVRAAEVRPGNRVLLHHAVVFVRPPTSRWLREAKPGEAFVPTRWESGLGPSDEILDTYVPGAVPFQLEPGQAKMIPAGSDFIFQMHYTANGKAGVDRSRIGLIFSKQLPRERVISLQIATRTHPVDARFQFQTGARIVSLFPHMHLRGKSMEYRVVLPGGESRVLLSVPNYDFNWQTFYYLSEQMALPKGARIEIHATFDNSLNNKSNPDPTKEVKWGDQSWEEMMVGYVDVAIDRTADPMDLFRSGRG